MSEREAARERVAEYLRQRDLQNESYRGDCIHSLYTDPSAEMADLLASDLRTLTAEPAPLPAHVDGSGDWARAAHALEHQAARAGGPRADA